MNNKTYHPVSPETIEILIKNSCWTDNWEQVLVTEEFDPRRVAGTIFRGTVKIGKLDGKIVPADGVTRYCGIFDANLHNVTIGKNCHISNVNGWLSNLHIGKHVLIENVGSVVCQGESTFGNGYEIEVLNEGGGRELKITDNTSAQTAYLSTLYRHDTDLIQRLNTIADRYAENVRSDMATVGDRAEIRHCQDIVNVSIGESAQLEGVQKLYNGSIVSSSESTTYVGHNVIAENFILQRGARVDEGAMLSGVLVGESSKIGKQFSAENSVFFANSEGFHSEVCSIFGGPYTVTHHRSTLLIAGMFSFYNAGSGTNQSNHMYKLGPVHQGILERGCKTGSSSYLLWPSRVGAFSAIMGKHTTNFDSSDFPFSYVNEDGGQSTIVPGMNFFTVGTMRDGNKWPTRDRRKHSDKLDQLNFEVLSPYTGQKMIKGQSILLELYEGAQRNQEFVTHKGISIKRLLLKTCSRYYRLAIEKYLGEIFIRRIASQEPKQLSNLFVEDKKGSNGDSMWIDVSGLLCTQSDLDELISNIKNETFSTFDDLHSAFRSIRDRYRHSEWNWFIKTYSDVFNHSLAEATTQDIKTFLEKWKTASLKLLNMVKMDALKEFEGNVRTGFGIDGWQDEDFEAVRGNVDENTFIKQLDHMAIEVNENYDRVLTLIDN